MLLATIFIICGVFSGLTYGRDGFPREFPQDWGYVDVRTGAHMFWWLHETLADPIPSKRPLVLWLQGGPGAGGSGTGNFEEFGPVDRELNNRSTTWINDVNVLFVDNPVGSGFSYVDSVKYLTTDNYQIARDLVELLRGFLTRRSDFRNVPLHIFSQSYGGKMASEFAYELYQEIQKGKIVCNLKSVALGNSWIDPVRSTLSWAPFLIQTGHIDLDGYKAIDAAARMSEKYLKEGQPGMSTDFWLKTEYEVLKYAYGIDFYNILTEIPYRSNKFKFALMEPTNQLLRKLGFDLMVQNKRRNLLDESDTDASKESLTSFMNNQVKRALGIPSNVFWGSQSSAVFDFMAGDFMKPVVNVVEKLLNETTVKVAVYTGQLDLICSTPATIDWINNMNWKEREQYQKAPRTGISVNGILEGFSKGFGNFNVYWISRAGHMAPADNPAGMSYVLRETTNYG